VILSPRFFAKQWPEAELGTLFAMELDGTRGYFQSRIERI
jgi:hypothetical protein